MQFQADLLGIGVRRPAAIETTALGAALFAGLAAGCFASGRLAGLWKAGTDFGPAMRRDEAAAKLFIWKKAVERAKSWEAD
jgi:glycerol kinase